MLSSVMRLSIDPPVRGESSGLDGSAPRFSRRSALPDLSTTGFQVREPLSHYWSQMPITSDRPVSGRVRLVPGWTATPRNPGPGARASTRIETRADSPVDLAGSSEDSALRASLDAVFHPPP